MGGFLYRIRQFMYGRNGIDGFGIFLFVLSFFVKNISYFTLTRGAVFALLNLLNLLILVFMIYRIFSRNLVQRRKENDFFMKYFRNISSWFKEHTALAKERAIVKQTHKIYVCPKCGRHLKVPKGKGKIEISCPCSYKFIKRT